ncbi:unnamed protein product, partial [Meganyctiphanes norvegica]
MSFAAIAMTNLSFDVVEEWLDAHSDLATDYFVRKAELAAVNKWLVAHGFLTVTSASRRGSANVDNDCLSPISPIDKISDSPFNDVLGHLPSRTNSRKHLRHSFAKSKSKSVSRTCEPSAAQMAAEARRSSFRAMRKYSSLPPTSNYMLCLLIESKVRLPRYESRTLDLKKQMKANDEKEFFLDIVKDIANDLNLKSLTQKFVTNVSLLLDADGASLFLVHSTGSGKKSLMSKVFDVHSGTNIFPSTNDDNAVEVPWGKGVLGYVAETGETVNLQCAAEDHSTIYNNGSNCTSTRKVKTTVCEGINNQFCVIAVAQVINKCAANSLFNWFTKQDEKMFESYLQFVGVAITNAQLMEASQAEYERNRSLLEVVHDLFEEQTSVENVILKILQRAQRLVKCERLNALSSMKNITEIRFFSLFNALPNEKVNTEENAGIRCFSMLNVLSICSQLNTLSGVTQKKVKFSKIFELSSPVSGQYNTNKGVHSERLYQLLLHITHSVTTSAFLCFHLPVTLPVPRASGGDVKSLLTKRVTSMDYKCISQIKIQIKNVSHKLF